MTKLRSGVLVAALLVAGGCKKEGASPANGPAADGAAAKKPADAPAKGVTADAKSSDAGTTARSPTDATTTASPRRDAGTTANSTDVDASTEGRDPAAEAYVRDLAAGKVDLQAAIDPSRGLVLTVDDEHVAKAERLCGPEVTKGLAEVEKGLAIYTQDLDPQTYECTKGPPVVCSFDNGVEDGLAIALTFDQKGDGERILVGAELDEIGVAGRPELDPKFAKLLADKRGCP